jgi:hypothetical protein
MNLATCCPQLQFFCISGTNLNNNRTFLSSSSSSSPPSPQSNSNIFNALKGLKLKVNNRKMDIFQFLIEYINLFFIFFDSPFSRDLISVQFVYWLPPISRMCFNHRFLTYVIYHFHLFICFLFVFAFVYLKRQNMCLYVCVCFLSCVCCHLKINRRIENLEWHWNWQHTHTPFNPSHHSLFFQFENVITLIFFSFFHSFISLPLSLSHIIDIYKQTKSISHLIQK